MPFRHFALSAALAAIATTLVPPAARAQAVEDWTASRTAEFTMTGNVGIAARKMNLAVIPLGSISGDGGVYLDTAHDIGTDALKHYAAVALVNNVGWATSVPVIGNQIASAAAAQVNPYAIAAAVVVILYNEFVTSNNTAQRSYLVYAPVAGRYHVNAHFKGHWLTKPANTISVTRSDGSVVLDDTRVLSSDADFDYYLNLPEGSTLIKIGLGSGSVNFHTAGQLNYAWLDDPVERHFVVKGVALIDDRISIASHAPENGDLYYHASFSPNAAGVIDGRIEYVDNLRAQIAQVSPLTYVVNGGHLACDEPSPPPISTVQADGITVGTPMAFTDGATWPLHRGANRAVTVRVGVIRDKCL